MNLYEETKKLWTPETEKLAARWAREMLDGLDAVKKARKRFRIPRKSRLRLYLRLSEVGKASKPEASRVVFSLRHRGQEVAKLSVGKTPECEVTSELEKSNAKYFGVNTTVGKFPWRSREATEFRQTFEEAPSGTKACIPEHEYESRILEELEKKEGATKFGGTVKYVRHCGPFDIPIQFPVPVSGNKGVPEEERGNIDILVRRGRGGLRLSVWEVKSPRKFAKALAQAYIYSVCLALMLRSKAGPDWYRLLRISRNKVPRKCEVPPNLTLEAVVVVTRDQEDEVQEALREFKDNHVPLEVKHRGGTTTITLHVAYYDPVSLKISGGLLPLVP